MRILCLLLVTTMAQAQMKEIESGVFHWDELPVKEGTGRVGRQLFEGSSPHFEYLEIHATTQEEGARPAPPHAQADIEEVIIVKEGTMTFTMDGEEATLGPGSVILIPPLAMQQLRNAGEGPLSYYVMMFRAKKPMDMARSREAGGPMFIDARDLTFTPSSKGGGIPYFNRPTAMCEHFEMHVTQLDRPGPSHDPHTHVNSEIILVIEGETEMTINGKTFAGGAGDLFFIRSGDLHGISNVGDKPCRYFAYQWF